MTRPGSGILRYPDSCHRPLVRSWVERVDRRVSVTDHSYGRWRGKGKELSELRSVLDQLGSIDPDGLSPEELAGEMAEVIDGQQRLEVLIAGWVKSISIRGGHTEMGYPNPTAMLTHLGRMSAGHAAQVVARANAPEKAPTAYAA